MPRGKRLGRSQESRQDDPPPPPPSERFVFAKLPNTPIVWPCKVVAVGMVNTLVSCCDGSFSVKNGHLSPWSPNKGPFWEKARVKLKGRTNTLAAWIVDFRSIERLLELEKCNQHVIESRSLATLQSASKDEASAETEDEDVASSMASLAQTNLHQTTGLTTPDLTTPDQTTPGRQTTPGQTTPGQTTPGQTTPGQTDVHTVVSPAQTIPEPGQSGGTEELSIEVALKRSRWLFDPADTPETGASLLFDFPTHHDLMLENESGDNMYASDDSPVRLSQNVAFETFLRGEGDECTSVTMEHKVMVDLTSQQLKLVVGPDGTCWNNLRQSTGCNITFVPKGNSFFECNITGPKAGVLECLNHILSCMEEKPSSSSEDLPSVKVDTPSEEDFVPKESLKPKKTIKHHDQNKKPQAEKEKMPRDKTLSCYFCGQMLKHRIIEHLIRIHSEEPEVASAAAKSGSERIKLFELIKNKGNFSHNIKVLKGEASGFVPVRRQTKEIDSSKYLPCIYCFGFFHCKEMWKHVKHFCKFKPPEGEDDQQKRTSVTAQARMMILAATISEEHLTQEKQILHEALGKMHDGDIKKSIEKDSLLLKMGAVLLTKLGNRRKNDVLQRLRQLARLKIECQVENITVLVSGTSFDKVVSAVKAICVVKEHDEGITIFEKPSLALTLGHNLKKVAGIMCGAAVREDDIQALTKAENFLKLMSWEWADRISTIAIASLKANKHNKPCLLPLTEDLVKLKDFLVKTVNSNTVKLAAGQTSPAVWRELAEATFVWVLLFNKRRGNEVAKMLIQTFTERPQWNTSANQEIVGTFTQLEKTMLNRMDLVQSQGKMDKMVMTLLLPEMVKAIETLINTRVECGQKKENKYIFANTATGHLDAWQTLNEWGRKADCSKPELISSTRLRKYLATVCQVLMMTNGEKDLLANHLAHNLHTHNRYYKIQEAALSLAKVSRLLIAAEEGELQKYSGKKLEDIDITDYVPNGEEEEPGDDQETEDHTSEVEGDVPLREVTQDADDIDILLNTPDDLAAASIKHGQSRSGMKRKSTVQPTSKKQKRKKTVCSSGTKDKGTKSEKDHRKKTVKMKRAAQDEYDSSVVSDSSDNGSVHSIIPRRRCKTRRVICDDSLASESSDVDSEEIPLTTQKSRGGEKERRPETNSKRKTAIRRTPWTAQENRMFSQVMKHCLEDKVLPSGALLNKATKMLPGRSSMVIRTKVHNIISGKQRWKAPQK